MSLTLPVCDHTMGSHLCVCPIYIGYFWNLQRGPHRCPQTIILAAATMRKSLPTHNLPLLFLWLLKPILSLHGYHWWANVLSAHFQSHQPRKPEQSWIPKRKGEISSLSNSVLPYISQAQRLFYLNFGMSLIKNLASSQPLPRNDSSEKSPISSGLHPSKRRGLTLVQGPDGKIPC